MHIFGFLFLVALGLATVVRLWLARRHIRHVCAHRDTVPAPFSESITLAAHQKAADYTVAKTHIHIFETLLRARLLLALTLGGGLQWLSSAWANPFEVRTYAHGIAIIFSVVILASALELPFSLYRTFHVEARFGFNRMTLRLFIVDLIKQALVAAALGLPLLFMILWLMDRMGDYWWLYAWLTWIIFNLIVLMIFPTVIAPLFNKFRPLDDHALKVRIENLLAKCGFKAKGLFVMDGSKRSSHGNAYFTGFGASKRIVFFDTLLARLSPPEIEAVLAHELGHFKYRHVFKRMIVTFSVGLAFLAVLNYLAEQEWFYQSLGIQDRSMAIALLLFFLVVPVFSFLFQPLGSLYSRKHEYEADAYAAGQANPLDLIHALVTLYRDNAATLTPDPVHSAFYDSHPPAGLRIERLKLLAH